MRTQSNLKETCKQTVTVNMPERVPGIGVNATPLECTSTWKILGLGGKCFLIFMTHEWLLYFYDAKYQEENSKSECPYRGEWVTS